MSLSGNTDDRLSNLLTVGIVEML